MAKVISLVPYTFLPAKNGGQRNIAYFHKYFSRQVPLLSLTTQANKNELAEGYETRKIFSHSFTRYINPFYFFPIRKLSKQFGATHLLIEHPYFGWLAVLLKMFLPVKLIVHSHNIEALRFKTLHKWWWKILWQYEKFVHAQADYNFFITENDRQYAIKHYKLAAEKCMVVTYGIEQKEKPAEKEVAGARQSIRQQYGIKENEKVLLFVGAFNYKPNQMALLHIEQHIAPLLLTKNFPCKIIICGPGLPAEKSMPENIIYAGFVEDISLYFKAADVFINPVTEGGGIKTKLVEALGWNVNAVSTEEGAIGVDPLLCNGKLVIVQNNDWENFAQKIIALSSYQADMLQEYYQHFYWGYSTKAAAEFISH